MSGLIGLVLILPTLFAASPPQSSLSSEEAAYDGKTLRLTGTVTLQHEMGEMHAEEAFLEKEEERFSRILLSKKVSLLLPNKGQILCEKADLDFKALTGALLPKEGEKLTYKNELLPLILHSNRANLTLGKEQMSLETLRAEGEVEVEYGEGYLLKATETLYEKTAGRITAVGQCTLLHEGDSVLAKQIELDLPKKLILMQEPSGHIQSFNESIAFRCLTLTWDQAKDQLVLSQVVEVDSPTLGKLRCDGQITIKQREESGKRLLERLTTQGNTELTYSSASEPGILKCNGPIDIDAVDWKASLDTPLEYRQGEMQLFADSAYLTYEEKEGHVLARTLEFEGHVRLAKGNNRCAVADHLTYNLDQQTLVFSAEKGQKVLLWDGSRDLNISARAIRIERDPKTKEERIKGEGSVQFAFSSYESELLRKIFPFYQLEAHANHP